MADMTRDWEKAIADYWALTGEKIPTPAFKMFFATTDKIHDSLEKCDRAMEVGADHKDLHKHFKDYKSHASSYVKDLEKLIEKERKERVKEVVEKNGVAVVEKMTTARHKGAKMLKTRLERYEALIDQALVRYEIEAKQMDTLSKLEKARCVDLRAGFAKAAAASAAIKANPTVETWDEEMDQGIRTLSSALGNWKAMKREYEKLGHGVPDRLNDPIARSEVWMRKLDPWASDKRRTLKLDPNLGPEEVKDAVLAELKEAMTVVKECLKEYQPYVNK